MDNSALLWQWLFNLLEQLARSAEALPFIIALGLLIGRRGNAIFCLAGNSQLLRLARWLGVSGFMWLPCSFLSLLWPYGAGVNGIVSAIFSPAGYPWLASFCLWLAGVLAIALTRFDNIGILGDRYQFAQIRKPFWTLILAGFLFFLALAAPDWPSGGLPAGLGWDRAIMAIARHSVHHLFMALCPAGAIALVAMQCGSSWRSLASFQPKLIFGVRWLAFWAAIGQLPNCLQNIGIALGLLLGGHGAALSGGFAAQLFGAVCLATGMVFWFWQLLDKAIRFWLGVAGLVCLAAYAGSPCLARWLLM